MGFSHEILGLNIENFGIVLGSPGLYLRLGFDPGIDVFGFCCVLLLENE